MSRVPDFGRFLTVWDLNRNSKFVATAQSANYIPDGFSILRRLFQLFLHFRIGGQNQHQRVLNGCLDKIIREGSHPTLQAALDCNSAAFIDAIFDASNFLAIQCPGDF